MPAHMIDRSDDDKLNSKDENIIDDCRYTDRMLF